MQKRFASLGTTAVTNRGFTLIELLIVVGIIAILSTIVLVSLNSAREKSKIARFKSQAKAVQTKAVSECPSNNISATSLGGNTLTYSISSVNASCTVSGTSSFTLLIDAVGLQNPCRATARETGIISFNGC